LGAGFSKWSCNLPLANELFDFAVEPWGYREIKYFENIKKLKKSWDNKNAKGTSEEFISFALNLNNNSEKIVTKYIVRRLSDNFIWKEYNAGKWRRHILMIDENRKCNIKGVVKAKNFIVKQLGLNLSGIITTNYDMIVEYALGTKLFNYGEINQKLIGRGPYPLSQWKHPTILKGNIPLSKIHGSISWDLDEMYTDGRRALSGRALIIAPAPEKTPPEALMKSWELAVNILKKSDKIIFFGFSFNSYDLAVLNLLKKAENIRHVLLIDINHNNVIVKSIWPNAKIYSCDPPPYGNKFINNWLNSFNK